MIPEAVFLAVKVGFLVLLWLFVLAAVRAIRVDVFGPRVPRGARKAAAPRAAAPAPRERPASSRPRKAPRQLVVTQGSLSGTAIPLGSSPVTIGRGPACTLVLTDDYASTHHARLIPQDGTWLVEDLGSTNGTFLDRAKVTGPTPVGVGSTVQIGKTKLELRR